jgi:hypothetical protein
MTTPDAGHSLTDAIKFWELRAAKEPNLTKRSIYQKHADDLRALEQQGAKDVVREEEE